MSWVNEILLQFSVHCILCIYSFCRRTHHKQDKPMCGAAHSKESKLDNFDALYILCVHNWIKYQRTCISWKTERTFDFRIYFFAVLLLKIIMFSTTNMLTSYSSTSILSFLHYLAPFIHVKGLFWYSLVKCQCK